MSDLVLDEPAVTAQIRPLIDAAAMAKPDRSIPSISMCGSDAVIGAYVTAFRTVCRQDANTWQNWSNLGQRTAQTLVQMREVDASIAAGNIS